MNTTPYQILDISPGTDWENIKKTYKKKALKWHPDKPTPSGFTKKQQEEKFKEINNAFEQIQEEKSRNNEENLVPDLNAEDLIDEIFSEAGLDNFENFENCFLDWTKNHTIRNIRGWMRGLEEEIDGDPNFWNQFGTNWEEKIRQMDNNNEINLFWKKISQAIIKISDEKYAKERAKSDEFVENSDKGLKLIKNYLRSKSLSNNDFNTYLLKSCPDLMTVGNNWYDNNTNWGNKDSINTYTSLIDNCADEKQRHLDRQRANWKKSQGGDNYSRALSITEINDYWGSETTINGKKLEEVIGFDWKSQINNSKGSDIINKKNQLKNLIQQAKQNDQNSSPREYLPYILGGIGIFALLSLIIVLATNKRRR